MIMDNLCFFLAKKNHSVTFSFSVISLFLCKPDKLLCTNLCSTIFRVVPSSSTRPAKAKGQLISKGLFGVIIWTKNFLP